MKLFFRKYGNGQPLIIMHGLFGLSDNWNTLAKKYGEHFTTYIPDLRNHGQSPHSDTWNYEVMVEDIVELMQDENISSAHIMGHSMGGKVAMFMAGKYPARLDKLVVSDMAPRYYPPHHTDVLAALNGLDLEHTHTRKEAEAYMLTAMPDFATRQFLLKNLYWKEEKLAWKFNLDTINRQIDHVGQAIDAGVLFEGPALFVKGGKSNYITDADLDSIQEHFPNSRLVTLDTGHWIHAEKPLEYLQATLDFLM